MKNLGRATWPLVLSLGILSACGDGAGDTPGGFDIGGDSSSDAPGEQTEVTLDIGTGEGSSFQSGALSLSAQSLSAGGSTEVSFSVVNTSNNNALFSGEETSVTLTSTCVSDGLATIESPVVTSSGSGNATYEAQGCTGMDTITATLDDGTQAMATLEVASQAVDAIQFVSAEPVSISLAGTSNPDRPNQSEVSFRLLDANGDPVRNRTIEFEPTTTLGGIRLTIASAETGSDGIAKTTLVAGTVNTTVSVVASTTLDSGTTIQTTSSPITISSAVPDQDSFSVSVSDFLPNADDFDGVTSNITVNAGDRNNNPAPDGTIINFVTSGGSIAGDCVLSGGTCTVSWKSQAPRPANGVATILVRTIGEESFVDLNSNGLFDDAEIGTLVEKGEPFLDRDLSGTFDVDTEEFFDTNENGQRDPANNKYDGLACAPGASESLCMARLKDIFQTVFLFIASDDISITINPSPSIDVSGGSGQVCATVSGVTDSGVQGPPPSGTNIDFSTDNGDIATNSSFVMPNVFTTNPVTNCVTVEPDNTSDTGLLTVSVTPSGNFSGSPIEASIQVID